jgi:HEAT repeat protein
VLTYPMTSAEDSELPSPRDPAAAPGVLFGELRDLVGEQRAADLCTAFLSGAAPDDFRREFDFFAGQAVQGVLSGSWPPYWTRVWGARGLLYIWSPTAAPPVIVGLGDPAWRVAEMCLKVSSLRELAEAAEPATLLVHHELPRVRANAFRTLGLVGDTEHVDTVAAGLEDDEPLVRRAADLAIRRMTARLDLPPYGGR